MESQRKVIKAQGNYDFIEESREGTFSGLRLEVTQSSIDNLRSIEKGQSLALALAHPNNGVCQGEWVTALATYILVNNLIDGPDRTIKYLMTGSRDYVEVVKKSKVFSPTIKRFPYLEEVLRIPNQILVNVAGISNLILATSPRETYERVCQSIQIGEIVGMFPTIHAQKALTEIDLMIAKLYGRVGEKYDTLTLPIGASFNPQTKVYTFTVGEAVRYQVRPGDPKKKVKCIAEDLGYRLASLVPLQERGVYSNFPG